MENEYTSSEWSAIEYEFRRIGDSVYLDHAGATLYSERQLSDTFALLSHNLYTNPHTSKATEDLIDQVRYRILSAFNTTFDEYSVVFTSGATASLRTVAECFSFSGDDGEFAYLADNHTSVLGMREVVNAKRIRCVRKAELREWMAENSKKANTSNSLVVLPAQCNFSGFKYPLEIVKEIQNTPNWYVCLDAASFAATNHLDLGEYPADFVCISFYKIFGYPTGLGALLVSRRGQEVLRKRYYGGGTVQIAMAHENWHVKRQSFHERFEDGTIPFLSIISLLSGFNSLSRMVPASDFGHTMERISKHCFGVARYLWAELNGLRHKNGRRVVQFYHDTDFTDRRKQGGIVNLNVLNEVGQVIGFSEMAAVASLFKVILRTGCFCNPGACQRHLGLTDEDVRAHFQAGHVCGDLVDLVDGLPTGSVRLSVGYMTSRKDVDHVVKMIATTFIRVALKPNRLIDNPERKLARMRLLQICVFPIKSCAAFKVSSRWPLTERGLKFDREWMIVSSNGVCLTQKSNTRLCMVRPVIDIANNRLWLAFPDEPKRTWVPLRSDERKGKILASLCQSKVCGDRIQGIDCGNEVAEWLSDVLCEPDLRLIRQSLTDSRTFKDRKRKDSIAQSISLANQAQFLLINLTSVKWLIDKVDAWIDQSPLDRLAETVDRFRGNLIVETPHEFDENEWRLFRQGLAEFRIEGPCTRCQMICIDQSTGEKTTEPLRTISNEFQGKVRFGIYMSRLLDDGRPRNGDREEVFIECGSDVFAE